MRIEYEIDKERERERERERENQSRDEIGKTGKGEKTEILA